MKTTIQQSKKNRYGQYFTPIVVADFMVGLADITPTSSILEPSCGAGVFLEILHERGFDNLNAYEIDPDLKTTFSFVRYESFVSASVDQTFDLVIGNPPYIRWKNLEEELKTELVSSAIWNTYFNSLCDYLYIFILKSIELLNENGQLIFICPEYWMSTTHSVSLRNYMMKNGFFEEIYHFNETPIFDKVTVSFVIFKYRKSQKRASKIKVAKYYVHQKLTSETLENIKNQVPIQGVEYVQVSQFRVNERWVLQNDQVKQALRVLETACQKQDPTPLFPALDEHKKYCSIGDVCDIGNGLVSGLDKAFQINEQELNEYEQASVINVVKAKDLAAFFAKKHTKYIFVDQGLSEQVFQEHYPNYFQHLQKYKVDLEKRYQYNRKINYWEWVFLRNFNLFNQVDKRIFVPCKERISNKSYFRFALVERGVFPTQDVTAIFKKQETKESIEYILAYLNQQIVFDWLRCNGIVKGNIVEFSEKPIASIPFRSIDWSNEREVMLHQAITDLVQQFLKSRKEELLGEINTLFNYLVPCKI